MARLKTPASRLWPAARLRAWHLLVPVMAGSWALCAWGLGRGLPSARQSSLVFPDPRERELLIPLMIRRREHVYDLMAAKSPLHSRRDYIPACQDHHSLVSAPPALPSPLTKNKLDTLRSFLLQSEFPDEAHNMKVLSSIRWKSGDFNPKTFVYGGLFYYPVGAALALASSLRLITVTGDIGHYLRRPQDAAGLYLTPKILGGVFFVLSIPLVLSACRQFYGRTSSVFCALLYAFCPVIIAYSHFLKPHAPLLLWVSLCLWFSARILENNARSWLALAGCAAGLSIGTFWYAGIALVFPLTARCLAGLKRGKLSWRRDASELLLIAACAMAAAVATNPYWVLDARNAWGEVFSFGGGIASRDFSSAWRYWRIALPQGLGWPAAILSAGGLLLAACRRSPADQVLLSGIIPFLFYAMSGPPEWWHKNLHLSIPIIPACLMLAGRLAAEFLDRARGARRTLAQGLLASAVAVTAAESLYYGLVLAGADQKLRAGAYINARVPTGASIGSSSFMYSGQSGYPPFRQAAYRLEAERCPGGPAPQYYISLVETPARLETFGARYSLIARFARTPNLLDGFFDNNLYPFLDDDVGIYRREG